MIPDQECNQDQESLPLTPSTCTDPTPPPPSPQYESEKKFLLSGGRSVHRLLTPSLPHSLTTRKRCWWIADYNGVFMVTHLACRMKRDNTKKVFYLRKQHNVAFTNTNVIDAKLSEERSRWKLEIILFSVDWAEVTIACSSTWHIEVKRMPEIFSWTLCNLTPMVLF